MYPPPEHLRRIKLQRLFLVECAAIFEAVAYWLLIPGIVARQPDLAAWVFLPAPTLLDLVGDLIAFMSLGLIVWGLTWRWIERTW